MSHKRVEASEFERILERKIGALEQTPPLSSNPTQSHPQAEELSLHSFSFEAWSRPHFGSQFFNRYQPPAPRAAKRAAQPHMHGTTGQKKRGPPHPWSNKEKDAYFTLKLLGDFELTTECSLEELKRSYRKLALEHHPDRNSGSSRAFLQLHEAFRTLESWFKRQNINE